MLRGLFSISLGETVEKCAMGSVCEQREALKAASITHRQDRETGMDMNMQYGKAFPVINTYIIVIIYVP